MLAAPALVPTEMPRRSARSADLSHMRSFLGRSMWQQVRPERSAVPRRHRSQSTQRGLPRACVLSKRAPRILSSSAKILGRCGWLRGRCGQKDQDLYSVRRARRGGKPTQVRNSQPFFHACHAMRRHSRANLLRSGIDVRFGRKLRIVAHQHGDLRHRVDEPGRGHSPLAPLLAGAWEDSLGE